MKYIDFKRFKFSTVFKKIKLKIYDFFKIFKFKGQKIYDIAKIFRFKGLKIYDFSQIFKFFNFKKIFTKKIYFYNKIKIIFFYSSFLIIFSALLYLIVPTFYNYEKSRVENTICKIDKIECLVNGKIKYSFFPTPRLKIYDVTVNQIYTNKKTIIRIGEAEVKLSIKNLWKKNKQKINSIELKKFTINLNLNELKKYKNIFNQGNNFISTSFTNGQIIFYNGNEYVGSIYDSNFNLSLRDFSKKVELKGKFLNDNIYIKLNQKNEKKFITNIILKMSNLNLLIKASFFDNEINKNTITGNVLIKKDKNRFTGIIDYIGNQIIVSKSNIRNAFLDGKLNGILEFSPYFDFDLDLSLSSLNFTKLYNYFLALEKNKQRNIFQINKKINGKLSLSSDKVYSGYNLVKAFESRIKFNNGNITFEQFLINLGKLGAADLTGAIINDEKFTNFKYESNIFIDNQKKIFK